MGRYVVGDIHGCVGEVSRLVEALPLAPGDTLVFLGDYIDRGPDSRGVVSYLLSLREKLQEVNFVFLKGNHEDMLLSYLGLGGRYGDMFLPNGGVATLASYGIEPHRATRDELFSAISSDHLKFFQSLSNYHFMDSFLCVHAGIHPEKSWAEQTEEELLWIRNTFIYRSHMLPQTVLFGHTPQPTVFYGLPYKVGLDTGLVYGKMLTCLEVDEKVLFQINWRSKRVNRTSVQHQWSSSSNPIA